MDTAIEYVGEQKYWGTLGHLLVSLALGGGLLAFFLYLKAEIWPELKRWARGAFLLHGGAVLAIFGLMVFLLLNHRFEYYYVWQHSNRAMSPRYIFSALWEGQEGSFLLWMAWHVLVGILLMTWAGRFESRTMWVLCLVQVFLNTMILGIQWVGKNGQVFTLGSDLFTLTRLHPSMRNVPLFLQPDYLDKLDGRGLNPLLQNYWMTIHPPVLFLGFAASVVPYAFVVGNLRVGDWHSWVKPVIPWSFAALALLGAGILMGAAWAYEALSFGGFWAWDPVENASLVPWLALAAGAHLLLLPRLQGLNHFLAVLFLTLSFILVLWSTFLTRSGILGNSSVHSFTDLGMSGQLLLYVGFFAWLPGTVTLQRSGGLWRWTNLLFVASVAGVILFIPHSATSRIVLLLTGIVYLVLTFGKGSRFIGGWKSSEPLLSREIWMFTGALVLFLSWFQIIHETSRPALGKAFAGIPVLQNLYPADYAPPSNIIDKYNYVQGLLAGAILLLMAGTQFLRYRMGSDPKTFLKSMAMSAAWALVPTLLAGWVLPVRGKLHYLLLFYLAVFSVIANGLYMVQQARLRWKESAASLAHMGFGLTLAGAVLAGGFKTIVSANQNDIINLETLSKDFKNAENLLLHRHDTVALHTYRVVYYKDSVQAPRVYFGIKFLDQKNRELFTLWPQVQTNPRMGDVAEPSTRHRLLSDLYTHISYVDKNKLNFLLNPDSSLNEGFREVGTFRMRDGDSVQTTNALIVFTGLRSITPLQDTQTPERLELEASFLITDHKKKISLVKPTVLIENNRYQSFAARCENTGTRLEVTRILPQERRVEVRVSQPALNPKDDFVILQAILFPGINLLWAGAILMTLGIGMAVYKRARKTSKSS